MKIKILTLAVFVILASGCATNPFSQFYENRFAGASREDLNARLMPYSGSTQIQWTANHDRDAEILLRRGYIAIGRSGFEGAVKVTQKQLEEQAKRVGADIVLYTSRYQGSHQASVPVQRYNPGTTTTTNTSGRANATVSGTGGFTSAQANYSETSTTTTSGTFSRDYVQTTLHRYQHGASFWRRARPFTLGVYTTSLPEDLRRDLGRNTGALVQLIVDDSPAFRANLLPGDVIIALGDANVYSDTHLLQILPDFAGELVEVKVIRNGVALSIPATMNRR